MPEWVAEIRDAEIIRYCQELSKVKGLAVQGIEEFSLQNKLRKLKLCQSNHRGYSEYLADTS